MSGGDGFVVGTSVPVSAHAYLSDLDRAAKYAVLEHDAVHLRLTELGIAASTDPPSPALAGDGGAITSPHEVLHQRRVARAIAASHGALEDLGFVAAWYARAAELYLRAVLTDGPVPTAAELERATFRRGTPEDQDRRRGDHPWWGGEEPPPVPPLDELLTGIDTVDETTRLTHEQLASAPAPHGPAPSQYLAWARVLRAAAEARARRGTGPAPGPWMVEQ